MSNEISFANLNLAEPLLRAIADAGYTTPTPIQAQSIPAILSGKDLLGGAQTGTGKTASFTLPILQKLQQSPIAAPAPGKPRCLILVPTRELATQVGESVQTYGKYLNISSMVMFGGVRVNPQVIALGQPVDILIATPGRLLDHCKQKTVDLSAVEILVLDEADRMLDMGFIREIKKIIAQLPAQRQNLLFSATFSDEIKALSEQFMSAPEHIEASKSNSTAERISQIVHLVPQPHKSHLLAHLIKKHNWTQVLVFTRTKHGANRLVEKLARNQISAAAIHGNKSQSARTKALAQFKEGSLPVLVATDIAARGLDIDMLPHVVNYELPNIAEDYVHRIGRTGRAGASGEAISFVDESELVHLANIETLIQYQIPRVSVEDFVAPVIQATPESPKKSATTGTDVNADPETDTDTEMAEEDNINEAAEAQPAKARRHPRRQRTNKKPTNKPEAKQQEAQPEAREREPKVETQPTPHNKDRSGNPKQPHPAQKKKNKPKKRFLSEAARHQAMPQPPLFSPEPTGKPARQQRNNQNSYVGVTTGSYHTQQPRPYGKNSNNGGGNSGNTGGNHSSQSSRGKRSNKVNGNR